MQTVFAPHKPDPAKQAEVVSEMRVLGAPTIRVVDCGDHYMAVEGSHRLAAAAALGLAPVWSVLAQDDTIAADSLDIDLFTRGETYSAGEVAGEIYGHFTVIPYRIEHDGTIKA